MQWTERAGKLLALRALARLRPLIGLTLCPMSDASATKSAVVKAGMARLCRDFTQLIAPLGFRRTNSRSRSWEHRTDRFVRLIYFHRGASTYGAPINHSVDIRVQFSLQTFDGKPAGRDQLDSDRIRDSRGYAYHLRFNAETWSMYDRCLEDLLRVTREHGLPWFEQNVA